MEYECLDWLPCQFINIVGNDDVAGSGTSGAAVLWATEVGKMKIVYLLPLPLPSTRHVATSFTLKKGQDPAVSAYYLRPLGRQGVEGTMIFFIESKNLIPRNRDCQRSTKIAVEGTIFAFGFLKKYDLSILSKVGYQIGVGHSTDLSVSMPNSGCGLVRTVHDTLYAARSTLRLFQQVLFLEICKYSILYLVEEQMGGNEDRLGNQHLCCVGCTVGEYIPQIK